MPNDLVPPRQTAPAVVRESVPGIGRSGFIESKIAEWRDRYTARRVDALTVLNKSESALFEAQRSVTDKKIALIESLFALQETPERLGHELTMRRLAREGQLREAMHDLDLRIRRHDRERTLAQAEQANAGAILAAARVALVDAQQQLEAQKNHGYFTYELTFNKKKLEMLDIELSKKERIALFRESQRASQPEDSGPTDAIDDALYARRDQLNAAGLDASKVEEAIARRRRK